MLNSVIVEIANLKEIKCPKCGKEYNQPTKFCNECGEKM